MQTLKPVGELIVSSWNTYTKYFRQYTKILAWYLALSAASVILSIIEMKVGAILFAEVAIALGLIISTFICIPALLVYIASEQKISIPDAFKQSKPRIWAFIWIGILTAFIVLGGFSLLMVPGIYLTICFSFAQYLVICEKKGGMQALWESAKLVRGQWWAVFIRIFVYSLALVALMFVATWIDNATNAQGYATNIITLAISLLGPLFMLYFYQIYNDLKSINKVDATVIPSKTKAQYSVLFVVGIIVPASLVIFGGIMASKYATSAYDNLINSDGTYNEENINELYEQYLQSATAQSQSGEISPSSTD